MTENKRHSRIVNKKLDKKKKKKKILLYLLVFSILLVGAITTYAVNLLNKAEKVVSESYEDNGRDKSDLRDQEVDPTEDHISILFIGIDNSEHRNNTNALSDALIFATLNKTDKSVKMLSIPRDSYVYIPKVGYKDKITHAHSFGGINATIDTVEELLEVPVDYNVRLNFDAFVDVVDALGGITVDVPYEFTEQNSKDQKNAIHLYEGEQTLNGEEALALARTRKLDNDLERGKRQQQIMKAILDKTISVNSVFKLDDAIEAVGDNMTTNFTFGEMRSLLTYGTSGSLDIETLNLTGSDLWADRYYFELNQQDLEEVKAKFQQHLEFENDVE
ncbi:LCP family protein [Gracilibacillus salinarum]|uniref:LCP family protein n=1 Tax=Gracilibacillus salinarum TaxID=2932255 RepID=A0ABY4GS40_9BACI|nr:LCP family protein [Gracilibacillus salinarum]UOQ87036.1 LCP family protein [Gracilibacillus salinarum]